MPIDITNIVNSPVLHISWISNRQKRWSQQRRGEQSDKGMVEMARTESSDLPQDNSNKIEAPGIISDSN